MRFALEVLGTRLSVAGGSAELLHRLEDSLGAFRTVDTGGDVLEIAPGTPPDKAFAIVFRTLLDRIDRFVVVHAAALERNGRALLVAGPSGAGKTTLALALLERGFRLLSDDFAPMERASGLVHPFPKALRVRPGPGEILASGPLALADRPAPPAAIVLFDGGRAAPRPGDELAMEIAVAGDAGPLARRLAALPGITGIGTEGRTILVTYAPASGLAGTFEAVLAEAGDEVLEYGLVGSPPDPGAIPELRPLPASIALVRLLREVQNRRPGSALWRSVGGNPLRLATETARLLAPARFWWLAPGEPRATATLLAGLDL